MNDEELRDWMAALWGMVEFFKRPDRDGCRDIWKRSAPYFFWWDELNQEFRKRMGFGFLQR